MAASGRRVWTAAEEAEMWRRWREGDSVSDIARALGRTPAVIHPRVSENGGFRPRKSKRNARNLSLAERETISRGLATGRSMRAIARQLGRAPSTVSREIWRNGSKVTYRATGADFNAMVRAERPKEYKLDLNPKLQRLVAKKLELDWSPEQIAGWLKRTFPGDARMHVSHETIYRSLFIQTRGVLKAELLDHLRAGRTFRRSKKSGRAGNRGPIVDGASIKERPAEVEDRAVPGHWEGDLLLGDKNSFVATLVERQSRYVMLVKVDARDSGSVVKAVARQFRKLPAEMRRSLTWDRGGEMAQHKAFSIAADLKVYFCDPHSPWQRGSNENTNGLLRQYFAKGVSIADVSQTEFNSVARLLNGRPRKTLGFQTPAEKFSAIVASTG